ncbi:MAG TPA: SDR family NAD(P)-dependent oxidoreductase [Stellaceae bacterium]|nr:SDR family NAD(P)-dependent oxidoreductase [Stellaceae bacterium]
MALRSGRPPAIRDEPIAIVGASCRFPGADGLEKFWQLLVAGADAIGTVDPGRWATRFFYHPDRGEAGKSYTWAAGLIDGVDRFEPSFFGISPREAMQMDPQQRILLELVWHAFEDAGVPPSRYGGSDAGVYIGASATDYSDLRLGDPAGADSYFMTGNALSILANRISYVFDLRGPSLAVDTACSSSLVALHHACEAIRAGRISSAIVGGINLLLTPYPFLGFCRASMLSRRGRCFAFDERADGYVRSEGAGVVIVRPLADAVAAGDSIRAVILATGSNSDGRTIGLSLPSEAAQTALLQSVYHHAGIAIDDLALLEMHGTGTPAGDPVEAAAVGRALGTSRREPLPIGSVKTNVGHLEPASGMAGLLKAALALDRGVVPPTLHCETPNPGIDFAALKLRLVREAEPIAIARERRVAGVNSFGFGGTNAHTVLAAPPPARVAASAAALTSPLVISAATETSLRELVVGWRQLLKETPTERLPGLMRAAAHGRDHHRHRLAALGRDGSAVSASLERFLENQGTPGLVTGTSVSGGKLAYVFSGNGAQFAGMGRPALRANAAFRAAVEGVDEVFRDALGWSVVERIDRGVDTASLERADIAQPLLFAIQVGIVGALGALGIGAQGHMGHSVGEIAAAWAAGALPLADAVRVVITRSRCQQRTQGTGRMAALALGADAARGFLAEIGSAAEIAAFNAAHSVTVSGTAAEIECVAAEAHRRGLWCRSLDLDFAFHSALMEPIRDELRGSLVGLSSLSPAARLVSTVTGAAVENEQLDAEHWWRNIRNPVRFAEGAAALIGEGYRIFVEIGPSPILHAYLTDGLRVAEAEGRVVASLMRDDRDADPFPEIAARCYVAGDLASAALFDGDADPRGLPLYPWDRGHFWFDKTVEAAEPENPPFDHPLLGFRQSGPLPYWINHLDDQVLPWIADHAVEGLAVFPAAAIVETALAAARWRWPDARVLEAFDVEVRRPLPFDKGRMRELRTALVSEDGDWELASRPRLSNEPMTIHAVGRIAAFSEARAGMQWADSPAIDQIDGGSLYRIAGDLGLNYGGCFRTVEHVAVFGPDRAVVHLDPAAINESLDTYLLHPALLDGALQGLLALLALGGREPTGTSFLPWRFGRVRLIAPFGRPCRTARLRLTQIGVRSAAADLELYDAAGGVLAELTDCWFRRIELGRRESGAERMFRVNLVPAPLGEGKSPFAPENTGRSLARLAASRGSDPERREQAQLLDALIGAVAGQVLGEWVACGQAFSIDELVAREAIASSSTGLAETLLRSLEGLGGAVEVDGGWRIEAETDLPDPSEIWRLLLAEAPDLVAELALVGTAFDNLPRILLAGPGPSHDAPTMVEHLLQASPASADGIALLSDTLRTIAGGWPAARPLRILEIGANSNVTRRLLQCLAQTPATVAYLATSADPEQIERLAAMTRTFVGASSYGWAPGEAGEAINNARFDVVVAANACARLHLNRGSVVELRDLLVPGGLFLAIEPEPNALWDTVFGQTADWWLPDRSGGAVSPLRSGEEWQAELAGAGFGSAGAASIGAAPWPCAAFWGSAPSSAEPLTAAAAEPRVISLVGHATRLRAALLDRLGAAGHRVTIVQPSDEPAVPSYLNGRDDAQEIVLFLCEEPGGEIAAAQRIATAARIAHTAAERGAALWLVTCDAQQASPAAPETAGFLGAELWGFARVLANELPRLSLRLIDLAGAVNADLRARQIVAEISVPTPETEIVWTPQGRGVLRLRPGLPPRLSSRENAGALTLAGGRSGGLDALGWKLCEPRPPGPGEVEIEVHAAGLNFRDVMWAMGLLPEEALVDGFAGPNFGLECAGIVSAVGAEVEDLKVGDRAMAFAPASLGTRVVTVASAVAPIPPQLGFAAAATLPVAFVTVIYALGNLAQLEPGETVLIHSAAGGVGLAAIQYARHRGAVVIATAGSAVKRAFLRLAGADHVLDSRDLGFADAIRQITGGEGVDIVLNSLSGDAMERSLEVLKPFGRFLELGKRDFYLNRRLHLRPLRQNVSYFAIDVDQLPLRRPALARSLLGEISALLVEGAIRPLAHRVFRFSEIDDAFRLMQSSGHIGKLVLVPDADVELPLREPPQFVARGDSTYLVTGGVEGFGFEAARWLAAHGAGAIALLGRRGRETPGCEERVAELKAIGAEAQIYRVDVADRASLAVVLDHIRATQPPLRGVVHAASAIDDRLTADIDQAGIGRVLRPKIDGALALDALTRDDPIELFWLFSSATTLLGAPGQGAYVAANMALEALARRRHAEGRPALAVLWGPIEDAGYLAQRAEAREALARRLGAKPIPAAQALAALPAMLASGLPVVGCADANWTDARRFLPVLAAPLFSEIRYRGELSAGDEALADRLRSLDPEEALNLLKTVVAEEAARILRLPADNVDLAHPLSQMGMDSLMAVELRLALEARLRIDLPLVSLTEGTSVASIAARLGGALATGAPDAEVAALAARHEPMRDTAAEIGQDRAEPKVAAE